MGLLILCGVVVCWIQLGPWITASNLAAGVEQDVTRLMPGQPDIKEPVWYIENVPDNYKGAYVFRLGLGIARYFTGEGEATIKDVSSVSDAPLASDQHDAFALRFSFDERLPRFWIDYGAGITSESATVTPVSPEATSNRVALWDFAPCISGATKDWQIIGAQVSCEPGKGLALRPDGGDPQMVNPEIKIKQPVSNAQYIRLRVAALYPPDSSANSYANQWFWKGPHDAFSEAHSRVMPVRQDGKWHVYWTFLPITATEGVPSGLRFDPINSKVSVEIRWIVLETVSSESVTHVT